MKYLQRPIEQHLFVVVILFGLYALLVVRADFAPSRDEVLQSAVTKANSAPSYELTKESIDIAMAELVATDASADSANKALEGMRRVFTEPRLLPTIGAKGAASNAVPLEPLLLDYPHFFGTPDFIPVAGVAPAVHLQERSLRADLSPISLEPLGPDSHFSDKPRKDEQ